MTTYNASSLWEKAERSLKEVLHPDVFERWIAVIRPDSLENDTLTLVVDNDFYQTWLEEHYLPLIHDAVASVCGSKLHIVLAARKPEDLHVAPVRRKPSLRERLTRRPRDLSSPLNEKFSFDAFVVGPCNSFAHAASLAVAQAPGRAYNPLFIYGGVGLGKTHLMQAIGLYVLQNSRATVRYVSSETFTNEYIDALQARSLVQFRKKYRSVDLLLIDDIHFLAGKERLQEEFFHTFNALFDGHSQIVMTSDRPASEIVGLEKRLVSRFEWGLVTELEPPDLETRLAILRNKLAQSNAQIDDKAIVFIAERVKSNIRRLEGALVRVLSYASLTGREIGAESLQHLLRDTLDEELVGVLDFTAIQKAVASHYDLRLADLTSKRRPHAIAVPRQVAMYLCRQFTSASLPEIGNAFSKTHATVLYACRTIRNKIASDEELARSVTHIAKSLGKQL